MRSAKIAEWILARWTNREHAAAIVGDLLESAPGGPIRFWWAVVRTALAMSWRAGAGLAAAVAGVLLIARLLVRSEGSPQEIGEVWLFFRGVALCSSAVAAYGAARYGLGDRLTQLSAAVALACAGGARFHWMPGVVPVCAAAGSVAMALALGTATGRRQAAALAAAMIGSIVA